jgi:hypothetical protein
MTIETQLEKHVYSKDEACGFNAKPGFHIIDLVDRHGISKENVLFLNRHCYFEGPQEYAPSSYSHRLRQMRDVSPSLLGRP